MADLRLGLSQRGCCQQQDATAKSFHLPLSCSDRGYFPRFSLSITLNVMSWFGSPYRSIWICSVLSNTKLYFSSLATVAMAFLIFSRSGLRIFSVWRASSPSWPNFSDAVLVRAPFHLHELLLFRLLGCVVHHALLSSGSPRSGPAGPSAWLRGNPGTAWPIASIRLLRVLCRREFLEDLSGVHIADLLCLCLRRQAPEAARASTIAGTAVFSSRLPLMDMFEG